MVRNASTPKSETRNQKPTAYCLLLVFITARTIYLPAMAEAPLVTVIVPCYNSERTIQSCLTSLVNQRTSVDFEIVVVDSSSDKTAEIVEREFPAVRLIHLDKRTFAGTARNIGIKATSAPFCFMVDSDCIAESNLIEKGIAHHKEGTYAAVGGSLRNGTPSSVSGWIGYLMEFKEYSPSSPRRLERTVPTANVIYRRESLVRHGLFDDQMRLSEDISLNWRIYSAGEQILFDPTMQVTHLNRTGWRAVLPYQTELGWFSALARIRGGLPGQILVGHPALVVLMPFVRLWRAFAWLASNDRRAL